MNLNALMRPIEAISSVSTTLTETKTKYGEYVL